MLARTVSAALAGPEADARHVPLPHRPQTDDEPSTALRQPELVGVPDHRGIEERGALEGVFLREVGPDEELAGLRDGAIGEQVLADGGEPLPEEVHQPLVPAPKLRQDVGQQPLHLRVGEFHDPADELHRPLRRRRLEGPEEDAGVVGLEDHAGAGRDRHEGLRDPPSTVTCFIAARDER